MSEIRSSKIWHNGQLIGWDDANVHVMSHALHYGTSWFEGIRCYQTERGSEIFRLQEHVQRLFNSAKIYRTRIPFSQEELIAAIKDTILANELEAGYIRPLVFRGLGTMGVNPLKAAIEVYIMVWEWGTYLGEEALKNGVDVMTSSWSRAAPNTFPSMAKAGGNYLNSALIKMEAVEQGFSEGLALDVHGYVSEGSGENLFLVYQGKVMTSSAASAILPGLTRNSVIQLLKERGHEVIEQQLPREMLYLADEVFMTGTAVEVTPVRSIDKIDVGEGRRGPLTAQVQEDFFAYVKGEVDDRHGWMTPVRSHRSVETTVGS